MNMNENLAFALEAYDEQVKQALDNIINRLRYQQKQFEAGSELASGVNHLESIIKDKIIPAKLLVPLTYLITHPDVEYTYI